MHSPYFSRFFFTFALAAACACPLSAAAQVSDAESSSAAHSAEPSAITPHSTEDSTLSANSAAEPSSAARSADSPPAPSLFARALEATPPERASFGKALAADPQALADLDAWIEKAPLDDPKSLLIQDLIFAMPSQIGGPRAAALAVKSTQPQARRSWARWLSHYPSAYAQVLNAWMKQSSDTPSQFVQLIEEDYRINPKHAMSVWTRIIARNTAKSLEKAAVFGLDKPSCADDLSDAFVKASDETSQLRILRALIHCEFPSKSPQNISLFSERLQSLLTHKSPSRRIAALDLIGSRNLGDDFSRTFVSTVSKHYESAKNTTERAAALRALHHLDAPNQKNRLIDALQNGDEALRLQAASLIAKSDMPFSPELLTDAFDREIWPDIQANLYISLMKSMDAAQKSSFRRSILMDENRAKTLRLRVLNDIAAESPNQFSAEDMAALQNTDAPDEILCAYARALYEYSASDRQALRAWIAAQQPFNRQYLPVFAAFVRIDERNEDNSALPMMRGICAKASEQMNILQPCLNYMISHGQTDEDRNLAQELQKHKDQFDAMTGLEFD